MEIGKDAHRVKSLSRHTLEQLVMHSSEGILLADAKDPTLRVVYANPAYEDLSGYSLAELTGKRWPLAQRDIEGQPELERLKAAVDRAEACRIVVPDRRKDGTTWISEVSVEPLHNARGELKYFLCIQKPAPVAGSDASSVSAAPVVVDRAVEPAAELESAAAAAPPLPPPTPRRTAPSWPAVEASASARPKLMSPNRVDPATGLLRVEHFLERMRRDVVAARRDRCTLSFAVIEIVEFDSYRQTFGVKAGDSCQRMIGVQLTRVLRRGGDLCGGYDGSSLVAAVLGQEPEQLRRLMDQVVENVRQLGLHNPRAKSGRYIWVRYTVAGISPASTDDPDEIIARARAELCATPVPTTAPAHVIPSWAAQAEAATSSHDRSRGKTPLAALS
jgi:PAS domain S-box-containing protein/diguanylate cyclase (GGDEF)-like protein